jgi:hypothetical protein
VAAAAATPIAASLAGPPFLVSVRAVTTTMAAADDGEGPYCLCGHGGDECDDGLKHWRVRGRYLPDRRRCFRVCETARRQCGGDASSAIISSRPSTSSTPSSPPRPPNLPPPLSTPSSVAVVLVLLVFLVAAQVAQSALTKVPEMECQQEREKRGGGWNATIFST